jgi:Ca-activated chloride channel homolog
MRARLVVVVMAVAAVTAAVILSSPDGSGSRTKPSANALRLRFVYSPEKQALIEQLIARFNSERRKSGGRDVFIDGEVMTSGAAETQIARRRIQPVIWSPASSLWGRLLNYEGDSSWVPRSNPSIIRTPLVIAMWEPLARALGWPRRRIGFRDVLALATSPRGWAAYGKPQFGTFKLGHTNPDFSTSGLSAVAAEYYAVTGKREGLTVADVDDPATRRDIRKIERSIVHYGDTTLFFAEQLAKYGPGYASAVAMEEVTLVDFNENHRGTKLVAIYPSGGTFYSDDPLITLHAPWVTRRQKAGAAVFASWLKANLTPALAARYGFRPADLRAQAGSPIDAAHGADPAQPRRVLSLPDPDVLARVQEAWRRDRKPANVVVVVDTSSSMSEEDKIDQAKGGLRVFFSQLSPQDRVGLVSFSDNATTLARLRPFGLTHRRLERLVSQLFPNGNTALYDATGRGVAMVRARRDPTRINAVVVLSDGEDNASSLGRTALLESLRLQSLSEGLAVRVFTIAYGRKADRVALEEIADSSGGNAYAGDETQVADVFNRISSYF